MHPTQKGILLVLATAVTSGFSIFISKYSLATIEPYTFTFLKNIVVAVFLLSILLLTREITIVKTLTKKQWLQLMLIGLIGGSIPFLLFFKGLSMTSAAVGSFIHKTLFIYASLFAVLFLKEKISKKLFIAAILLLSGSFFLLKMTSFSFTSGSMLIFLATLFWAAENVLSKHVLQELSGNITAFGRMFFGSLFILIFLAFTHNLGTLGTLTPNAILWTLISSALLLIYVTTYYNGLKLVTVSTATSLLLIGSPITTLLSFFFGSALSIMEILGILLTVIGGVLVILAERSARISPQYTHNG